MVSRRRPGLSLKTSLLLLVLLLSLATLQYRWTGEVGRSERERMQESLTQLVDHFTEDFDREMGRAFFLFVSDPGSGAASVEEYVWKRLSEWKKEAPYPEIIREILLVDFRSDAPVLLKPDLDTGRFAPVPWPEELQGLKEGVGRRGAALVSSPLVAGAPAIVVPVFWLDPNRNGPPSPRAWVVLRLDANLIASSLVPELAERHFRVEGADYALAVFSRGPAPRILYSSDAALDPTFFDKPDITAGLFSFRGARLFGREEPPAEPGARSSVAPRERWLRPEAREAWRSRRPFRSWPGRSADAIWEIRVRHRAGSLEAAVSRTRLKNLGVSLGILALLGASVVLVVLSSRRAHALARQQMEFVAGVSHELRTPLAVIRSAAENLAHGVVRDRPQVEQYGSLIEREGRRLSEMVDRVLAFAQSQSSGAYKLAPVLVGDAVEAALAAAGPLIREEKIEVENRVARELPPVNGDAVALTQALENLITNAIKYGGTGRWVGLTAERCDTNGGGVAITVSDRGRGIDPADLPHIFEPFYRGKDAAQGGRRGSGLGLSLVQSIVQAHGGCVTVESEPGRGSSFTVVLPAESSAR